MRAAIIDFETTRLTLPSVSDLHKQPRIIEIGLVVVCDGVIEHEMSQLVYPGEEITAEITKITGITNEQLTGQPRFEQVVERFTAGVRGADQLWAHNAPFDCACLEYELRRAGVKDFPWPKDIICSVQEYVHEFGRRPRLTELYERKMGTPLAQTHRALDDCRALAEVLIKERLI